MTTTWLVVNVALIAAVAAVVAIPAVVIPLRLSREHTPVSSCDPGAAGCRARPLGQGWSAARGCLTTLPPPFLRRL